MVYRLIQQPKLYSMINGLQLVKHLFAVACVYVGNYISYLCIGYQELAYDINIMPR